MIFHIELLFYPKVNVKNSQKFHVFPSTCFLSLRARDAPLCPWTPAMEPVDVFSGVIKRGWEIPELNGSLQLGNIEYQWGCSIAMFDHRRVTRVNNKHTRFIIGSWGFTVDNQQNLLKTLLDDLDGNERSLAGLLISIVGT